MKPDPKPNLSRAAILANLEYYGAQSRKAAALYRQSLEDETYWLTQLRKLNDDISHNTCKQ